MENVLEFADIVLRIGGALAVILLVVLLVYLVRIALVARGIIGGVKKTVDTAQQSVFGSLGMISNFFSSSKDVDYDLEDPED